MSSLSNVSNEIQNTRMRQEIMGFGDAVASAGPYGNNLHLAADR